MKAPHEATRIETDTLGEIAVPASRYWGAQTQRSLEHFEVGGERMPAAVLHALGLIKRSAAFTNAELGNLSDGILGAIVQAATEVIAGELADHFPLSVWQTGSGTHTNMNLNEVIANRANEILGYPRGSKFPVHPNDHVNLGQSSNDTFSTAMHMAAVLEIQDRLLPALLRLKAALHEKESQFANLIKVGRTHLMDAAPVTLGSEFSTFRRQVEYGIERIKQALSRLYTVPQGGTAVGTGLNADPEFGPLVMARVSKFTGKTFVCADQLVEPVAAHDALVFAHAALKTLAVSLLKIANDIRWMASGPRCGLNELILKPNEAGSSMMPGKANPTQCESLMMVCYQVFGNDVAIGMAGASGNFELNVAKPMLIANFLRSVALISDSVRNFVEYCLNDLQPDVSTLTENVERSLMSATALTPHIGYDQAARIVTTAHEMGTSLKDSALALGLTTAAQFDEWADPQKMIRPIPNDSRAQPEVQPLGHQLREF